MEIARKKTKEIEARAAPPDGEADRSRIEASEMERRRRALSESPIRPGWVVSFRGWSGLVEAGTIAEAIPSGSGWRFQLSSGVDLSEHQILSVARVESGRWLGAWTVAAHGLSGEGLFDD